MFHEVLHCETSTKQQQRETIMTNTVNYTDLEKQVFNSIVDICMDECEANCKDIQHETGIDIKSIKGALGSLVKKGMVVVGQNVRSGKKYMTTNPIINDGYLSFGYDSYDEIEILEYKL